MRPFLNGFVATTVSVGIISSPMTSRTTEGSPLEFPARTRLPDAKITSGLSVSGSTTTSPRIPCALRISPTIAYSGSDMCDWAVLGAGGCFVRLLADRDCHDLAPDAESLLVTALEYAGAPEERPYGVRRLGAEVEPVVGPGFIDLKRTLVVLTGS